MDPAQPQWSPLVKKRDDQQGRAGHGRVDAAAMEPAREERDDRAERPDPSVLLLPPQWSPLVKSGMTSKEHGCLLVIVGAAMEPAREERDDPTIG